MPRNRTSISKLPGSKVSSGCFNSTPFLSGKENRRVFSMLAHVNVTVQGVICFDATRLDKESVFGDCFESSTIDENMLRFRLLDYRSIRSSIRWFHRFAVAATTVRLIREGSEGSKRVRLRANSNHKRLLCFRWSDL